jgi:hypothetical protein
LRVAACLGAWLALLGHWDDLGGFTRELVDLSFPICPRIRLLEALPALLFGKVYQNAFISKIFSNWKEFFFTCQVTTEENSGGIPRHGRHK